MRLKKIFTNYFKTIIWSLIVFYILFSPADAIPKNSLFEIPYFDKYVHVSIFAILSLFFLIESKKSSLSLRSRILSLLVAIVLLGILSETIQKFFIPGRSGNIYDFFADLCGFAISLLLYRIFWIKIRKISNLKEDTHTV
jgi:VanZ family protein